jgi:multicomponent Na+:H+ antiporter subunit D
MAAFAPGESVAAWMILAGVAINAAIPPLHAWLTDGYPQSTVTGAIFLSALTTKSAVYVLARIFPGWDLLIAAGVVMALYGVVYAVLANDIRQILAYSIISQVGYMVAGVGIGTELALNGTAAHAFSHILYKALLFMGAGAVLEATGRSKLTELGGLAPHMPWVVALYMVGAFSISGFPLFNGFISKSIIVTAAGESHHYVAKFLLILASIGTFLHTGLKLPYWTWFGNTQTPAPPRPIPPNMLLAMGLVAAGCVFFGVFPRLLYGWLPHAMDYQPYTIPHLVETTQLLVFTFVAFWILRGRVAGEPSIALDTDWFYRRPVPLVRFVFVHSVNRLFEETQRVVERCVSRVSGVARNPVAWLTSSDRSGDEFEPDRQRPPLGAGIALTLLVVVVIALITLLG